MLADGKRFVAAQGFELRLERVDDGHYVTEARGVGADPIPVRPEMSKVGALRKIKS